jgi:hypothetical protein
MKELLFVSGENCELSAEVAEKVELFQKLNPEIKVTKIAAEKDGRLFFDKTNGHNFSATPAFASLEDGLVLETHQGWACENRLLKMFSPENPATNASENELVEVTPGPKKILLFFASSDCEQNPESCNKIDSDFDQLLLEHPEVEFLKVDVEAVPNPVPDNCYNQTIYTVPTLFLIQNHNFVKSREGSFALEDLKDFIS